jgi:hypothetical protein
MFCAVSEQSDQIGRIFAYCAIIFFGQISKITDVSPNFWATIFSGKNYVLI